jgi:hypothetical protein
MNWKRFSSLNYDVTVDTVIVSLGLEIPLEGRPHTFVSGFALGYPPIDSLIVKSTDTEGLFVVFHEGASSMMDTDSLLAVSRRAKITKGTATGDALRRWISLWTPNPPIAAAA